MGLSANRSNNGGTKAGQVRLSSQPKRTHKAANELTEINAASTYVAEDTAGNMTKIPKPTSWTAAFDLKYDAWNRLVEVKDGGTTVQTNEFDGLGRRIQRVASSDPSDYYYNEEWQLLEERKNGDADPLNQYLWHPYYIDALALRWYDADTNPGTGVADYYYLQDANFNVTAVTDTSGDVVERYAYSPYGKVSVLNADFTLDSSGGDGLSDIGNTHLYTGRERDPETGLQLNRKRFYTDLLGRWLTRDPIRYRGGMNLYGYVGGMPTRFVDPTGEIIPIIVVGGVIGGYFLWPDPANAPAPGDPTYPDNDLGLPIGVIVGGGTAGAGRCACRLTFGTGGGGATVGSTLSAGARDCLCRYGSKEAAQAALAELQAIYQALPAGSPAALAVLRRIEYFEACIKEAFK